MTSKSDSEGESAILLEALPWNLHIFTLSKEAARRNMHALLKIFFFPDE
jgi:hypothetical protein